MATAYAVVAAAWLGGGGWLLTSGLWDASTRWIVKVVTDIAFISVTAVLLWRGLVALRDRKHDAESLVELLAQRSPDMIFRYRIGPEPGYDYVSPAAEALTGYPVGDFYRDADLPLKIVHPEDREALRRQMADPEAMGEREEIRWIRRDGSTVWLELKSNLVRDEAGRPVAVEGIVRDVTARREGERRGRILEAAAEAASDSIMITDADGTIEYVNPAFSRITGWDRDEALGRNPRILKSGNQDPAFYRRMWRTLEAGRIFQARFVNRRADGSRYTHEATITPIVDASGRVEHYVSVARDVTERELLELQLREAQRMHAVDQVVGGVSHDFRNLLAVVQAQVELARDTREDRRFPAEELDEIARATERGVELIRKLLTLARSDDLERAPLSLARVVEELRPTLRAVLPATVALDVHVPGEDASVVVADRGSIEQIIINLATNARDALPQGGHVTVELGRANRLDVDPSDLLAGARELPVEGSVVLRFRDDGDGMDAATLRRVFEPFFTTKPPDRGTGLGMPMIARMARLNGGTVTVSSEPGVGTTVTLYFPASSRTIAPGPEGRAEDEAPPRGRGQRVLVAEDESSLLAAQSKALERLGYETLLAEDGDEAIRLLEEHGTGIHLVMADLVMPGRGGKEVFEEMGVLGLREIPIVFMSGYAAADLAGRLPEGGEAHFIEKPWTLLQLAHKVADVLKPTGSDSPRT